MLLPVLLLVDAMSRRREHALQLLMMHASTWNLVLRLEHSLLGHRLAPSAGLLLFELPFLDMQNRPCPVPGWELHLGARGQLSFPALIAPDCAQGWHKHGHRLLPRRYICTLQMPPAGMPCSFTQCCTPLEPSGAFCTVPQF